jgi:RNA polymerase sigma-B factor
MTASATLPRPLAQDERTLLARWQRDHDEAAREALVHRYLPAARQLARRYARAHESIDDLAQAATIGLIQAIDRFDLSRDTGLSTYAFPMMAGELKRYLRNTRWMVHMPRGMQERTLEVRKATERLSARLDRSPTPEEIGEATGLEVEEVLEALLAEGARDPASLQAPRHEDDDAVSLADTIGHGDEGFELIDDRAAVAGALRSLPERERRIVELRFGRELTQSEIAARVGVSQMQVSRLLRRAIGRMRIVATGKPAGSLEEAGAG